MGEKGGRRSGREGREEVLVLHGMPIIHIIVTIVVETLSGCWYGCMVIKEGEGKGDCPSYKERKRHIFRTPSLAPISYT